MGFNKVENFSNKNLRELPARVARLSKTKSKTNKRKSEMSS